MMDLNATDNKNILKLQKYKAMDHLIFDGRSFKSLERLKEHKLVKIETAYNCSTKKNIPTFFVTLTEKGLQYKKFHKNKTIIKLNKLTAEAAVNWRYYKRFKKYGLYKIINILTKEEIKEIGIYFESSKKLFNHIKYIWYKNRKGLTSDRKENKEIF